MCHSVNKTFSSQNSFSFYPESLLCYHGNDSSTSYSLQSLICISPFYAEVCLVPTRSLLLLFNNKIIRVSGNLFKFTRLICKRTRLDLKLQYIHLLTLLCCIIITIIILKWLPHFLPQWKWFYLYLYIWKFMHSFLSVCVSINISPLHHSLPIWSLI